MAVLLICAVALAPLELFGQSGPAGPGSRLKLPVGTNTPAIAMGRVHGIILASDGSLWSWETTATGFPF